MTTATATRTDDRALNLGLWVGQIWLVLMFLYSAQMKFNWPAEVYAQVGFPMLLGRFIATMEVLGVAGLLLPALTRVLPRLTGLAAIGLLAIPVLAASFHLPRGEYQLLTY